MTDRRIPILAKPNGAARTTSATECLPSDEAGVARPPERINR